MPVRFDNSDDYTRGGLGVIGFVFFVVAFLLTIGLQLLLPSFVESAPPTKSVVEKPATELIQPQSDFAPEKVVALQLAGLAETGDSRGIQQCFIFASPSNKEMTGPLSRFAAMVQRPPYDALIRRNMTLIGKPIIEEGVATVMVTVLDRHDEIRVFHFVLSKQEGEPVENCWMTDAVYPLQQLTAPEADDSPTVWHSPVQWGFHG